MWISLYTPNLELSKRIPALRVNTSSGHVPGITLCKVGWNRSEDKSLSGTRYLETMGSKRGMNWTNLQRQILCLNTPSWWGGVMWSAEERYGRGGSYWLLKILKRHCWSSWAPIRGHCSGKSWRQFARLWLASGYLKISTFCDAVDPRPNMGIGKELGLCNFVCP